MPEGVEAARALGLDLMAAGGRPFRGIRFTDSESSVEAAFPQTPGVGIRRIDLHRAMVEKAREVGVQFEWNTRIEGIVCDRGVQMNGQFVRAKWIVGADGSQSMVRRCAGLEDGGRERRRYGFRRHFAGLQSEICVELLWARDCQLYVTPVGREESCVALISRDPRLRLSTALDRFPRMAARLAAATALDPERGAVTISRRLQAVTRGATALIGDASGSVDAITGAGLSLQFQQAIALASAMATGDLAAYEQEHRRIARRPQAMSGLLLLLDRYPGLRLRTLRAMAARPRVFTRMLAVHVGELPPAALLAGGLELGWRMLFV
jgi:2-polyprenyl-6-methoxyphenol hydroxylase-like FAD-dependent oxidoreductase